LRELNQRETEQLIETLLAPDAEHTDARLPHFMAWLFAETDGQPLFLTETLKALVDEGLVQATALPSTGSRQAIWRVDWSKFDEQEASRRVLHGVQEIIRAWLARITPQAKDVLAAAAILAQHASFEHLCHVAGLDEVRAIEALDELLGKQLLHERVGATAASLHGPAYSLSHQKVSDVVYAEAGGARRRLMHRRAFEALRSSEKPAADLAHHALNAGLLTEAIQHSLIAGNAAMTNLRRARGHHPL
jgi:predicted ATPase